MQPLRGPPWEFQVSVRVMVRAVMVRLYLLFRVYQFFHRGFLSAEAVLMIRPRLVTPGDSKMFI